MKDFWLQCMSSLVVALGLQAAGAEQLRCAGWAVPRHAGSQVPDQGHTWVPWTAGWVPNHRATWQAPKHTFTKLNSQMFDRYCNVNSNWTIPISLETKNKKCLHTNAGPRLVLLSDWSNYLTGSHTLAITCRDDWLDSLLIPPMY